MVGTLCRIVRDTVTGQENQHPQETIRQRQDKQKQLNHPADIRWSIRINVRTHHEPCEEKEIKIVDIRQPPSCPERIVDIGPKRRFFLARGCWRMMLVH